MAKAKKLDIIWPAGAPVRVTHKGEVHYIEAAANWQRTPKVPAPEVKVAKPKKKSRKERDAELAALMAKPAPKPYKDTFKFGNMTFVFGAGPFMSSRRMRRVFAQTPREAAREAMHRKRKVA